MHFSTLLIKFIFTFFRWSSACVGNSFAFYSVVNAILIISFRLSCNKLLILIFLHFPCITNFNNCVYALILCLFYLTCIICSVAEIYAAVLNFVLNSVVLKRAPVCFEFMCDPLFCLSGCKRHQIGFSCISCFIQVHPRFAVSSTFKILPSLTI
jgi:hypothetical protein